MPTHSFDSDILAIAIPAGQSIVRVHQLGRDPLWFGPAPGAAPSNRFDAPAGEYRVLYGAHALKGAFVETVLRKAKRLVGRPFVEARGWTELACKRELRLAKVYDEGLIHHGVTNDICAGDDYTLPREFAAAVYGFDSHIDGIAYRARHNNGEICYALFDRIGEDRFVAGAYRAFKDEPAIVDAIMREHGAMFDPLTPLPPL